MDIYSMMDEKSKQNLKKMMEDKSFSNSKPVKKKEPKQKTPREDSDTNHLEEFHFKTSEEFVTHVKKRKKAFCGMGPGWITLDDKDPDMVISYQRNENTGKMEFKYERFDAFKAYATFLETTKKNGYIEFWHKKSNRRNTENSDSD